MTHQHSDSQRQDERTHPVEDCPRCGNDHGEVTFQPIENPIPVGRGTYRWWWLCPRTRAPVLAQLSMEEA